MNIIRRNRERRSSSQWRDAIEDDGSAQRGPRGIRLSAVPPSSWSCDDERVDSESPIARALSPFSRPYKRHEFEPKISSKCESESCWPSKLSARSCLFTGGQVWVALIRVCSHLFPTINCGLLFFFVPHLERVVHDVAGKGIHYVRCSVIFPSPLSWRWWWWRIDFSCPNIFQGI